MELNATLNKNDVEYPASAIIHGNRNAKKLFSELEEYIKRRDEKIGEFGTNGSINSNDVEAMKKFHESMQEFDKVEIEVEIAMISLDDFMKFSYHPNELTPFEFMIE